MIRLTLAESGYECSVVPGKIEYLERATTNDQRPILLVHLDTGQVLSVGESLDEAEKKIEDARAAAMQGPVFRGELSLNAWPGFSTCSPDWHSIQRAAERPQKDAPNEPDGRTGA